MLVYQNILDLHSENYKILKEFKALYKWRDIRSSWIRRPNLLKISICSRLISMFNAILIICQLHV